MILVPFANVKKTIGTPPRLGGRDARGNGRLVHHSLFSRSERAAQVCPTARPGSGSVVLPAMADRTPQGATGRAPGANTADFQNNGSGLVGRGHNSRSTGHEG
jgi:hypothetical protein